MKNLAIDMPYTLQQARRLQDEARQKAFTTKDPWERCEYIREMNQWEGYISAMIDWRTDDRAVAVMGEEGLSEYYNKSMAKDRESL